MSLIRYCDIGKTAILYLLLHWILIGLATCKAVFTYFEIFWREHHVDGRICDYSPEVLMMNQFWMIIWGSFWEEFLRFLLKILLWINDNRELLVTRIGIATSLVSSFITVIGLIVNKEESKPVEPPLPLHLFDYEVIDESPPPDRSFQTGDVIYKKLTLINKSNYMWQSHSLKCVAVSAGLVPCSLIHTLKDTSPGDTTEVILVFRAYEPGLCRSTWEVCDEKGFTLSDSTQALQVDLLIEDK